MPAESASIKKKALKTIFYGIFSLLTIAVIASEMRAPVLLGRADPTTSSPVLQGSLVASSVDRVAGGLIQTLRNR